MQQIQQAHHTQPAQPIPVPRSVRPAPQPRRDSGALVGLLFVGLVMTLLFSGGAFGVLVTRATSTAATTEPVLVGPPPTLATDPTLATVHDHVVRRFRQIIALRQTALVERDEGVLQTIYVPGSPNLRRDREEIRGLLEGHRRWDGLILPASVFRAYQLDSRRWMVIAQLGRSGARLETDSGALLRQVPAAEAVYWCTMLDDPVRGWRLDRMVPAGPGEPLGR